MKIAVVGAGNVGATAAQHIAQNELSREVVLLDVADGIPHGKGLDLAESSPVDRFDTRIVGTSDSTALTGADIVIITAGIARKPGMSRDDLLATNADIVGSVSEDVARYAPESILIVVTNPLDVMACVAFKRSGFPPERVGGLAHGQAVSLEALPHRAFWQEVWALCQDGAAWSVAKARGEPAYQPVGAAEGGAPQPPPEPPDGREASPEECGDGEEKGG